jgi:uncharacterized membrane protein YeiB
MDARSPAALSDQTTTQLQVGGRGGSTRPLERTRLVGVDVARGVALLGMIAVHVIDDMDSRGNPTLTTEVAAGRASTLFVMLAGVGLALLSGGQRPAEGRARTAIAAGIAVRALLIGAIGLLLGELFGGSANVEVILPYYGLLFLLAIPLLGLLPRTLAWVTAAVVAVAPVVILWIVADVGTAELEAGGNVTFTTLFEDPGELLSALLVTGSYPVLAFMAYLCAGMAIGRLNLSSSRLAAGLLGGGIAMALGAQLVSSMLLFQLGGLRELVDLVDANSTREAANQLLWDPDPVGSWWYLALPAPHSSTPIDLLHTLGSAMAVLGAALLLCRVRAIARLLRPLAAAGSMTLTLYTAHLLVLATGVFEDEEVVLYLLMVVAALAFGYFWQRKMGQGPLERLVASTAGLARRAVAGQQSREGRHRRD